MNFNTPYRWSIRTGLHWSIRTGLRWSTKIGLGWSVSPDFPVVKNDSIFLNGFQHNLQTWYSLSLTSGNFLAFKACMTNRAAGNIALFTGAIGAGIASTSRILYVLSLRTGNVRELTKEYLIERLKGYPTLLDNYKNERKQESEEILIKYINSLNQIVYPN